MLKISPYQNIKNNFQKNARSNFPRKETSFKSDFVENNEKQNNNNLLLGLAITGFGTALITGVALYKNKLNIKNLKAQMTPPDIFSIYKKTKPYIDTDSFLKEFKLKKEGESFITEAGEKFSGEIKLKRKISFDSDYSEDAQEVIKIKNGLVEEDLIYNSENKPAKGFFFKDGKLRNITISYKNNYFIEKDFGTNEISRMSSFFENYSPYDINDRRNKQLIKKEKTIFDIGRENIKRIKKIDEYYEKQGATKC